MINLPTRGVRGQQRLLGLVLLTWGAFRLAWLARALLADRSLVESAFFRISLADLSIGVVWFLMLIEGLPFMIGALLLVDASNSRAKPPAR